MLKNYLRVAFRNMLKHKGHTFINIAGLSVGMAVVIAIALWIYDELSYDHYHKNHSRIAWVQQHVTNNGEVQTWQTTPYPLAEELRRNYGSDFRYVALGVGRFQHILSIGEKKFSQKGMYFEPQAPEMLSLKMIRGSRDGLKDPSSILINASVAKTIFGNTDPINKSLMLDNRMPVKVAGVYEDLPSNSSFDDLTFIAPWTLFYNNYEWIRTIEDPWRPNAFQLFVQVADKADMHVVSAKIKDVKLKKVNSQLAKKKPALFLHPMDKWHLYGDFKDGINVGGRIQYVWMFGIIGAFVLLLACINFMNLSTARSEKRAKEVGIRKAIGSLRTQLIFQFFSESVLAAILSFLFAIVIVVLLLPFFNEVADKKMSIPWSNPVCWMLGIGCSLLTGLIAGSYPAFYLSSFIPVKVLKGTFKTGKWAAVPRKVLVVLQFSVSVTLIIGTIIVFQQVRFARERPVGYSRAGLISIQSGTTAIHDHFNAVKEELMNAGAITTMAEASNPVTEVWSSSSMVDWTGKDPNLSVDFGNSGISYDYGKTIGWEIKEGRDFSRQYGTDSLGLILNEAAVRFMGLKQPVGETIRMRKDPFTVIGVIKDMVMQSPYEPVKPMFFYLSTGNEGTFIMRINPAVSAGAALAKIEPVFKRVNPAEPFSYKFTDEEYGRKFSTEERVGKIAGFFAVLAILISCLGLFGMASFMAEQRTKELGVRKVLGASVFNLWRLLSKEFVLLVIAALFIAVPLAYYFAHQWLQNYSYRYALSAWVFAAAGMGALLITVLTVSYQSIKAALANPVKSLRSE
jgi:putative ABC transport system permease protein